LSNFLAIATVTETLRQMLNAAVSEDVNAATATAVRPANAGSDASSELPGVGVNIFLYQVSFNPSWRNADLPCRRSDGTLLQKPRVALDLYYLLTFYGSEKRLEPQRVLGSAVRALHSQPVLLREGIQSAINSAKFLSEPPVTSDLSEEMEQVKLTPLPLTLDELSKLWSVFFQVPYTLSVAYQASVIFIEGKDEPKDVLPVASRNLQVVPLASPQIDSISPQILPKGGILKIKGRNLKGNITRVSFGEETFVDPDDINNNEINVTLPPGLTAGINIVRVVHFLDFGTGTSVEPHLAFESNASAFMLFPVIKEKVKVFNVSGSGNELRSADMTVKIDPEIGAGQEVVLLLNEIAEDDPKFYRFDASSLTNDAAIFYVSEVMAVEYFVRVRIDGAESPLDFDPASPEFGPRVKIP
jgi:hypothetical protein